MSVRLIPTRTWDDAKALLRPDALAALTYVLERIEDDPYHRLQRRERPDGAVVDFGAERLLVAYRVVDTETVHLLAVIDLMDQPGL